MKAVTVDLVQAAVWVALAVCVLVACGIGAAAGWVLGLERKQ